jgi:hypothetical protein
MTKSVKIPNISELHEALTYNPNTGEFVWLISDNQHMCIGEMAGTKEINYYRRIMYKGVRYKSHRLAWFWMTGAWPKHQIDHINGIKHDNRWSNLREATNMQNQYNTKIQKSNTSGFKGVHKKTSTGKWVARITIEGKRIYLGEFNTPQEANESCIAIRKYTHKEFYNEQ